MLWEIANLLRGCPLEVGAQNASWEDQGPFTGEVSPKMLAGWCHYLLIGHSERRQLFNETDEQLNRKLQAGFRNALKVILAVGETLEEHELGRTREVITRQLNAALYGTEVKRAAAPARARHHRWLGIPHQSVRECDCRGEEAQLGCALDAMAAYDARGGRGTGRAAGGPTGQLRGRPSEHRRRPHRLPGPDPDQPRDPGWQLRHQSRAARRDAVGGGWSGAAPDGARLSWRGS